MQQFNIRVYGIWINANEEILLSDERIGDFQFTKFPGGGLEYGEGIADCLIREWKEELGVDIEIIDHLYTTDFFQISAFNDAQIISVYYRVKPASLPVCDFKTRPFDFLYKEHEECNFRLVKLRTLNEADLTLPIDKVVLALLKKKANILDK